MRANKKKSEANECVAAKIDREGKPHRQHSGKTLNELNQAERIEYNTVNVCCCYSLQTLIQKTRTNKKIKLNKKKI